MGSPAKKSMLFVLLDESGSMSGIESDVVGSVNTFIDEQRKLPDPAVLAIAVFSSDVPEMVKFIRPMADLKEIQKLTAADFKPTGWTPLLDATGKSIQALDVDWVREKPDRCIFVTFTDGKENASKEFSKDKIKSLVQAREKSGFWSFLFLGANIDAFEVGSSMGYTTNKMSNYVSTGIGTRSASYKMSASVGTLRSADAGAFAAAGAGISDIGLGGDIAEDGTVSKPSAADLSKTIIPPSTPPAAAMKQETWAPQNSSALFDPKVEAWKPPQT